MRSSFRPRSPIMTVCCDRSIPNAITARAALSLGPVCHQTMDEVSEYLFTDNVFRFEAWISARCFAHYYPLSASRIRSLGIIIRDETVHSPKQYEELAMAYLEVFPSCQNVHYLVWDDLHHELYRMRVEDRGYPDYHNYTFVPPSPLYWSEPRKNPNFPRLKWLKAEEMRTTSASDLRLNGIDIKIHLWSWNPSLTTSRLKALWADKHHRLRLLSIQLDLELSPRETEILDKFLAKMIANP